MPEGKPLSKIVYMPEHSIVLQAPGPLGGEALPAAAIRQHCGYMLTFIRFFRNNRTPCSPLGPFVTAGRRSRYSDTATVQPGMDFYGSLVSFPPYSTLNRH